MVLPLVLSVRGLGSAASHRNARLKVPREARGVGCLIVHECDRRGAGRLIDFVTPNRVPKLFICAERERAGRRQCIAK